MVHLYTALHFGLLVVVVGAYFGPSLMLCSFVIVAAGPSLVHHCAVLPWVFVVVAVGAFFVLFSQLCNMALSVFVGTPSQICSGALWS